MHSDLVRAIQEVDDSQKRVEKLIRENESVLNVQPSNGGWTMAECVDHLSTILKEVNPPLKQGIHEGKAKGNKVAGPFRYGFIGKWITKSMEPPIKQKMKANKIYVPRPGKSAAVLLEEYADTHNTLHQLIREADGIDLAKTKVTSPALRILRIAVGEWFFFINAHERRHIWQMEQIAKALVK